MGAIATGIIAGCLLGFALQRSDLCFHSAFRGLWERRYDVVRGYALAVGVAAVGLSLIFALGPWDQLSRGLGFRPVQIVIGGLMIGVGMVVAASCTSGLFYKLGSGMVGAAVGLAGWAIGELAAKDIRVPGPTVLGGGDEGTIPGVLGAPRLLVALVLLAGLVSLLWRGRRAGHTDPSREAWRWHWPAIGVGVGLATIAGWALAGAGGATFGPSTTGAVSSIVAGSPNEWQLSFLVAIVLGSAIAARTHGGWWVRGETIKRLQGLFAGGLLLGAGAIIAGGCNLGHGLSGVAQLNVSSTVAVLAMIAGVGLARAVQRRIAPARPSPSEEPVRD
ncbi:MAG: YeeE/YedE family protein [Actinomycetota bacterium]|nr:YeeE/YedE family protein [Actinomycetota bacterium]